MAKAPKGKAATVPFSPHIHGPKTVSRVMWDVVIALLPALFASIWFFGTHSIRISVIAVGTAVITELLMNLMTKRKITILDGSAVVTGLLFAFNLPPNTPWYVIVIGTLFAIAIVKWAFGGLGQNVINPALGARIFVLAAWSTTMINNWSPTIQKFLSKGQSFTQASESIVAVDAVSSASPLNDLKAAYESGQAMTEAVPQMMTNAHLEGMTALSNQAGGAVSNIMTNAGEALAGVSNAVSNAVTNAGAHVADAVTAASQMANSADTLTGYSYWDMFIGNIPGSIGETSALALLIGLIYLTLRKVVFPVIPAIYIGVVALLTWILGGLPLGMGLFTGDPLYHILGGGLFLGAIFMATDYVTTPMSAKGNILFAVMLGILTVIIRLWGGYPEGVSYSIVLMNFFVPIIDRYIKPRIYGKEMLKGKGGKA